MYVGEGSGVCERVGVDDAEAVGDAEDVGVEVGVTGGGLGVGVVFGAPSTTWLL